MEARRRHVQLSLGGFWTDEENTRSVSLVPIYTHKFPNLQAPTTYQSDREIRSGTIHNSSLAICPASWYESHLIHLFNSLNIDFVSLGFDLDTPIRFVREIVNYLLLIDSSPGSDLVGFHVRATLEFVTEFDDRQMTVQDYVVMDGEGVMVMDEVRLPAMHDDVIARASGGEEGVLVLNGVQAASSSATRTNGPINKLLKVENVMNGAMCPVCLDEFCSASGVLKTPCDHLFHDRCISRWLQTKATCPMCRRVIA